MVSQMGYLISFFVLSCCLLNGISHLLSKTALFNSIFCLYVKQLFFTYNIFLKKIWSAQWFLSLPHLEDNWVKNMHERVWNLICERRLPRLLFPIFLFNYSHISIIRFKRAKNEACCSFNFRSPRIAWCKNLWFSWILQQAIYFLVIDSWRNQLCPDRIWTHASCVKIYMVWNSLKKTSKNGRKSGHERTKVWTRKE